MGTAWKARLLLCYVICIVYCFAIDEVRLVDINGKAYNTNPSEGFLEFRYKGEWGGICFNDFMKEDGGVMCRHLNFRGISHLAFKPTFTYSRYHDVEISCYGSEDNLHKCHHSRVYEIVDYKCDKSGVYISCVNQSEFLPANSTVRLGDGNISHGEVKSFSNGTWTTICGENWGELEGSVVCLELGFRGVGSVRVKEKSGFKPIAKYKCNGHELSLTNCKINNTFPKPSGVSESSGAYEYSGVSEYESIDNAPDILCRVSVDVTCLRDIDFILPSSKHIFERKPEGNLTLRCNATNAIEMWWKHQTYLNEPIKIPINISTTVHHLNNISTENQGSYVCVAKGRRGQIVENEASQTVVIPDYVQILLHFTAETSDDNEIETFQNCSYAKFAEWKYDVFLKDGDGGNFTLLVGKVFANYTTIIEDVDKIVVEILSEMKNNTNSSTIVYQRKEGLSFCIGESDESHDTGTLNYPSATINSRSYSNELCISSKRSRASRECIGDLLSAAVWKDTELTNCFAPTKDSSENTQQLVEIFFQEVKEHNVAKENVSYVSRDLADITTIVAVTEEAIDNVANLLEKIAFVESPSPTVTRNVIETVSNVVNQSAGAEEVLNAEVSSTIIKSLEQQLDNVKESGSNFSHTKSNIAVEIVQIEDTSLPFKFEFLQSNNGSKTQLNRNDSTSEVNEDRQVSVQIPSIVLQHLYDNCSLQGNVSNSSLPVSFTTFLDGALFNDSRTEKERNSLIVSASMLCDVSDLPNGTFISTLFTPTLDETGDYPWECVFWKRNLYNETGGWATEGCLDCGDNSSKTVVDTCSDSKVRDPVTIYSCSWTHLTNFAVLLDVKGDIGTKALDVISVIGCVISIISLLVTIISHLFIKKLRSSQPKQIVLMLCATLLGLYWCFLIGIDRTEHKALCVIFGGLIHFFCLSSVTWMSIEATQLYLLLVKVINANVRHFVMKASLIAWGIPFAVVVVCIAVASDDYAHKFCFPKHCSYVFYICVLGLLALLLAYNIVVYIMIVRSISTTRKTISTSQSNRASMIRRLQNALAISVLLGLSWVFGFLAIGSARMVFNSLFCLFNSFQGFFIFLLFCLRQDEIREAWRGWLRIAICIKVDDGTGTVSEKPSTSTGKQLTSESEFMSKSVTKSVEKSEQVELLDVKPKKSDL